MTNPLPIACTLSAEALGDRLGWIAELNRANLRGWCVEGSSLRLEYRPEAAQRVRELVAKEQKCCAFLRFEILESSNGVELRVDAPSDLELPVESLFAPFLSGASDPA